MLFENRYIRSVQETQIDSSKDSANWVLEWGITINSQSLGLGTKIGTRQNILCTFLRESKCLRKFRRTREYIRRTVS